MTQEEIIKEAFWRGWKASAKTSMDALDKKLTKDQMVHLAAAELLQVIADIQRITDDKKYA